METPKKTTKREKNTNRLKLHVDGQGGSGGLDLGGLVLWGGSLVIAGLVTAFTIRNRRKARNGNTRNQEDCRDGKGLEYDAVKDQSSHDDIKQGNLCCMDSRVSAIDIALEDTFVSNYNLIHENPTYEIEGKMDSDKEILPSCDPIPEDVTCGDDQQGVVTESLMPVPDYPHLPKDMRNMNKGLSPVEQSTDLSGKSKGCDLPQDAQMHEGELLISDDDESLQASNATYVHKEEVESPRQLISKEDKSLLKATICDEEKLEEEESATQSFGEEEEKEESDDDGGMEIEEVLAQLLSDEGTHQVPKPPHCEYMKEQSSTPSTGGHNKPLAKYVEEGDMLTMSIEQDKEEDNNSEYDDEGINSNEIVGYNAMYHEKTSEETPASSIESNSEPIWPAESIDETSFELKETKGFSQDHQYNSYKNLSSLKKEVSSCFSCEKDEGDDICNRSIGGKHNPQPMPPFLGQVIHEAVKVSHGSHTLKAKNWLVFIVALFLLTFTLFYHRFVNGGVLDVKDFPSR